MKMKKSIVITFLLIACVFNASAQFHTAASRSELGLMLGGAYYIGDLNRFGHFKGTQPAGSLFYRYNINTRVSFRANLSYGNVVGDDAWAKEEVLVNRNLNFKSDIFELGAGVEFHYMPFQMGSKRYRGTAYFLLQLAMFRMIPKTNYDGEWVHLRPLGTEGQGSDLNSKGHYSLVQMSIPIGLGFKLALGKSVSIGIEYGIRKTFTDYLDDVKMDTYVDPVALAAANGPLAAQLSNRSMDGDRYGKRGTAATKDWYAFFGLTLTCKLGNPKKCAFSE